MKCPNCFQSAPDTNYKCPHCGQVLKTGFNPPPQMNQTPKPKNLLNLSQFLLIIAVVGLGIIGYLMIQQGNKEKPGTASHSNGLSNSYQPGERIDIEKLIHSGKTTIFDFYSEYCGPCRQISPRLEQLDQRREDIVVVKININRNHIQGIDWNSPLARQYELRSIPYFIIYDSSGQRTHEGNSAWQQVHQLLTDEGV